MNLEKWIISSLFGLVTFMGTFLTRMLFTRTTQLGERLGAMEKEQARLEGVVTTLASLNGNMTDMVKTLSTTVEKLESIDTKLEGYISDNKSMTGKQWDRLDILGKESIRNATKIDGLELSCKLKRKAMP